MKNRKKERERNKCEDECRRQEEPQWAIIFIEHENRFQHPRPISEGMELADTSRRTVAIGYRHLHEKQILIQRVDRHFRLDLKPF